jgi:hypothetical protein
LFCRGTGPTSPSSTEFEGSQEFFDEDLKPMMVKIIRDMKTDPEATIAYWETLPQGTQAMLRTAVELRTAIDGYYAGGGGTTPEAELEARRYLEAYGDATFYSWVAEMGEGTRQSMIRADDALEAAFQRGWAEVDPRGKLLDGTDPVTADPSVVLLAQIDQKATALAVTVSEFSAAGEDDISDASRTYVAVMEDIGAYQKASGADPSTKASLYDVGAAIGPALAVHGEQQDADSLATLASSVELLCQWTSSLVTS